MLNRRILRVKAMQALYGYFTAVESIKEMKRNELEKRYTLDLSRHDFVDKALFETQKKQAIRIFNEKLLVKKMEKIDNVENEVIETVKKVFTEFENEIQKEIKTRKNNLIREVKSLWDTYIKLLLLPNEIEYREELESEKEDKTHLIKEKKIYPFIGNGLIKKLKASKLLQKEVAHSKVGWDNEQEDIKIWYRKEIRPSKFLKGFFEDSKYENTMKNDIVLELYKRVIFKNETISSYLMSNHLHWIENQPIIKSMIIKTIKSLQDGEELRLAELTKNGEDDFKFLECLFTDVVAQNDFLEEIIQNKTVNWNVDRIALTDCVILKLSLVEMMNSPSIPLKVTINEAIEISKTYSTPKSKQFVNGVLDVLSNELTLNGKIRKSGRGLIDNK